jgi:hypothetical protein
MALAAAPPPRRSFRCTAGHARVVGSPPLRCIERVWEIAEQVLSLKDLLWQSAVQLPASLPAAMMSCTRRSRRPHRLGTTAF